MTEVYRIRAAKREDIDTIVGFTVCEAREAEEAELDPATARRGVTAAFGDPPRSRYWVAQAGDGRIVASTSVVTEWSDFHGGDYWWVQSIFIEPEHRGTGLLALLLDHLAAAATAANAIDLRLYAHRDNARALRAYGRSGFTEVPYVIMHRALRRADDAKTQ